MRSGHICVTCDRCNLSYLESIEVDSIEENLAEFGWAVINGEDVCPDCLETRA